jgi:hypothetical protein
MGGVNLMHPVIPSPVYSGVLHLDWWPTLHILNLVLFPMLGLAAYALISDLNGVVAGHRRHGPGDARYWQAGRYRRLVNACRRIVRPLSTLPLRARSVRRVSWPQHCMSSL